MISKFCRHCGKLGKVYTLDNQQKAFRPYCDACYHLGVARFKKECVVIRDDERLVDTGYKIEDRFNELIHPDGTIETPVPDKFTYPNYFFENIEGKVYLMRVLEVGPPVDTLDTVESA